MFSKDYWRATAELAVRAFAGSLVALLGVNVSGILDADWQQALSVAALATVVSVLTSLSVANVGPHGPTVTQELPTPVPPAAPAVTAPPVQDRAERERISSFLETAPDIFAEAPDAHS